MASTCAKDLLNKRLPNDINGAPMKNDVEFIKDLLKKELPRSEQGTVESEMSWHFLLDKHSNKKKKPMVYKKKVLTRKQRSSLGLLKLPRDGWSYKQLAGMRSMWRDYMRDNLDNTAKLPNSTEQELNTISMLLGKSELIGADVRVVRSKVPNLIGMQGTIVLETKSSFQIVSPDDKLKVLLKEPSVFEIVLDNKKFTIFGKHLNVRPAERSVRKVKSYVRPDL